MKAKTIMTTTRTDSESMADETPTTSPLREERKNNSLSPQNNNDITHSSTTLAPPTKTRRTIPAASAPLPLGWTQVKRKRKRSTSKKNVNNNDTDFMEWCCDDPSCRRPSNNIMHNETLTDDTTTPSEPSTTTTTTVWKGQAIICLHEMDSSWFQGYFLPDSSTKPWGLLGVQEEIDECLECADGGYKQITLSIFPPAFANSKTNHDQDQAKTTRTTTQQRRKKQSWKHVEWTGGDMMTLKSTTTTAKSSKEIELHTEQMFTGSRAVPYVNRYFLSIVEKLRKATIDGNNNDKDDDSDDSNSRDSSTSNKASLGVLDLIPDVAILTGPMTIMLPKNSNDDAPENQ